MKLNVPTMLAAGALFALSAIPCVAAETQPATVAPEGSVPLVQLITDVAQKTGKTFLVDPRVRGDAVLVGPDRKNMDYARLLAVLQIHGFAAVEDKNHVRVVPDANARQLPMPLITGTEARPNAQYVSKVIAVNTLPAGLLVPILRPMLPQAAHLVAVTCTNVLLVVDTFDNVQRIEKMVRTLDTAGQAYEPEKCAPQAAAKPAA
jgi:general secretion pathway protein D